MFNIVLFEPEIPPNTGNIMRLCANTNTRLHLIKPLGFSLDEKLLRRAALDYRDYASVEVHASLEALVEQFPLARFVAASTKGAQRYDQFEFKAEDFLVFGPETRGLPETLLFSAVFDAIITIPMQAGSRSINLSNAAAIILFEGLRQFNFTSY